MGPGKRSLESDLGTIFSSEGAGSRCLLTSFPASFPHSVGGDDINDGSTASVSGANGHEVTTERCTDIRISEKKGFLGKNRGGRGVGGTVAWESWDCSAPSV